MMMMKENVGIHQQDSDVLALKMLTGDKKGVQMKGQITDRIYDKDMVLLNEIKGENLVVNSFLNLIMCLLKHQSGYSGIQYWAVGSGANTWDRNMPTPTLAETRLTAEIGRVPIDKNEIVFLDTGYNEVSTPTNIIQITHTFGTGDCNGTWREFSIFGGNATEVLNSGFMINKRHHAIITKTEEIIIERIMRFTLNLM